MCPYLVCLPCVYFVNWLYISYSTNKFEAQVWGCTTISGESVIGLKFGLWKIQHGSCIVEENSWQGHWQVCRWIVAIPLHMHSAFPAERGGAMTIVTSFNDVTTFAHASGRRVYKKKHAQASGGCHLGFWNWTFWSIARKPLTLYFGCFGASCGVRVYSSRTVCLVYPSACAQTCLGHP